ncbi:MAG: hypothetical protein SPJ42_00020, partial [Oscillospiraceae bacterium]|nr:hypothetical protein [Oscillospiraceae bacterium]
MYSALKTSLSAASETFRSLSKIRLVMLSEPGRVFRSFYIASALAHERREEPSFFDTSLVTNLLSPLSISR